MIITVTSYKGGVGKTTTAIHLAAYLQRLAPTLLVDGDAIRSATKWSQRSDGKGLGFRVVSYAEMVPHVRHFTHIIIDTEGNLSDDNFNDLARGCDLMVVPAVPESVATDGLVHTLSKLRSLSHNKYRVLLTMVQPKPRTEARQLRAALKAKEVPMFTNEIPRLAAFEKAATEGTAVSAVHDRNAPRAWACYEAAAREISLGGR